jgi:hypothetical protein
MPFLGNNPKATIPAKTNDGSYVYGVTEEAAREAARIYNSKI